MQNEQEISMKGKGGKKEERQLALVLFVAQRCLEFWDLRKCNNSLKVSREELLK